MVIIGSGLNEIWSIIYLVPIPFQTESWVNIQVGLGNIFICIVAIFYNKLYNFRLLMAGYILMD